MTGPPGHLPGYHLPGTQTPIGAVYPPVYNGPVYDRARQEEDDRRNFERSLHGTATTRGVKTCLRILSNNCDPVYQVKETIAMVRRPLWKGGFREEREVMEPTGLSGFPIGSLLWVNSQGSQGSQESAITLDGDFFIVTLRPVKDRSGRPTAAYTSDDSILLRLCDAIEANGFVLPDNVKATREDIKREKADQTALGYRHHVATISGVRLPPHE